MLWEWLCIWRWIERLVLCIFPQQLLLAQRTIRWCTHTHVPKQKNTKELEETAVQLQCHCCLILIPAVKLQQILHLSHPFFSTSADVSNRSFLCLHKSSCGSKAGWAQITGDVQQIMKSILCLSVFQSPVQFLSVMPVFCLYFSHTHSFNPLSLCDECIYVSFFLCHKYTKDTEALSYSQIVFSFHFSSTVSLHLELWIEWLLRSLGLLHTLL